MSKRNFYEGCERSLVRISFTRNSQSQAIEITNSNDYYPFGMNLLKTGSAMFGQSSYRNYKYNGKELQETGMYDYGARMYMSDIVRWAVVDPLAETAKRWSPFAYAFNNPLRFIDPDGKQNKDIIKIMNDGKIQRTVDNNPYDTITNENGSKSIQIARTNVTEANPRGDSQIGDITEMSYKTEGHSNKPGGDKLSFLEIKDNDAAKQFFEFAADNTKVEFGRDIYKFNDGYTTNIISTNHVENLTTSPAIALSGQRANFGGNLRTFGAGKLLERNHSHPYLSNYAPSGFEFSKGKFIRQPFKGDATTATARIGSGIDNYVYTPGYGYVKYNSQTAEKVNR